MKHGFVHQKVLLIRTDYKYEQRRVEGASKISQRKESFKDVFTYIFSSYETPALNLLQSCTEADLLVSLSALPTL